MKGFSYLSPVLYLRNALDKREHKHEKKNKRQINCFKSQNSFGTQDEIIYRSCYNT